MSAFVQPLSHIDLLVSAGLATTRTPGRYRFHFTDKPDHRAQVRELTEDTANEIGAILAVENMRSVNYRYEETDLEQPYEYHEVRGVLSLGVPALLKAIDGYEYQSCEHPDWWTSTARQYCLALTSRLITMLEGYDTADTWSYDHPRGPKPPMSLADWMRSNR